MARRRKKIDALPPGFKPVKHELKFGWCVTGHHNQCRTMYTDWNEVMQECICQCHKEKK